MITKHDLERLKEQIQEDLLAHFDGTGNEEVLDKMCDIVVDNFAILIRRVEA